MRRYSALTLALLVAARPLPLLALEERTAPFAFGDDSSTWANDLECDDMRFTGPGMTSTPLLHEDIGAEASDCRSAFFAGTIDADPLFAEPASPKDIVWGDDTGDNALDGRCDDLRFTGYHASRMEFERQDVGHDGTDCRAQFVRGVARWKGAALDR